MPRIIVLDDLSAEGLQLLDNAAEISYEIRLGLKDEALRLALLEFDGAICRSGVKITAKCLEGNRRLKAIVRAGVGTDNIDKSAATRAGIIVMNTPAGNTVSTAEHTMALLLGLARQIAPAHGSLERGVWDRKSFSGVELNGKTLGIIGLGRIGQTVASFAKAFNMRIVGYDPFLPRDKQQSLPIDVCQSLDELLPQIDFLTVHTPLTPETENMIGAEQIARMKPGCRLVNCARGGIYEESALVEALASGALAGVALDVYTQEPCTDHPLFKMRGALCTPHLGASTEEAQRNVAVEAVQLLLSYLQSGEIRHAVNALPIDVATLDHLRGYLNVAFRLGLLLSQWHGGAIDQVKLTYSGDIASEDPRLLTAAFCAGLLAQITQQCNLVNAELLCQERGITIHTERRSQPGAFSSLIAAEVSGEDREFTAAGTVFGKSMPRLVRLQSHPLESFLDGHLLVFTHNDVPGIIGFVGKLLAEQGVNIAQMAVGRAQRKPGGPAIGVLNLDSPAPDAVMKAIAQHSQIGSVQCLQLPGEDQDIGWLL